MQYTVTPTIRGFGFACDITPLSGLTIPLEMPFKNCDASYASLTQKILHDFLKGQQSGWKLM